MRRLFGVTAVLALGLFGWAGLTSADPWKDESGKGRERGGYARYDDGFRGRRYGRERVRIPRGHLPPRGECRTWYPGLPAGHQPPPYRC